jgi:hypothetical protein
MLLSAVCDLQSLVSQLVTAYAARAGWLFGRRGRRLSRARQLDVRFVVSKYRGNSERTVRTFGRTVGVSRTSGLFWTVASGAEVAPISKASIACKPTDRPALRGKPLNKRVLKLTDGTIIEKKPRAASLRTWDFESISDYINGDPSLGCHHQGCARCIGAGYLARLRRGLLSIGSYRPCDLRPRDL